MSTVTGLFNDRESAERAYAGLMQSGYDKADISLVMSDATRQKYFSPDEPKTDLDVMAAESVGNGDVDKGQSGTRLGGPLGGTLGIIAPVLASVGVLLIPGLGLVAAGPVAIALTAAGSVGVAGGLIGALTHWGIPTDRMEQYEAAVRDGGILMGVEAHADEDAVEIQSQWLANGAQRVHA